MGSYATTTAMQTTLIGVIFDTATTALVSKCIDYAEGEVRKYLARRYDVTAWVSGSVPPQVAYLSENLADAFFQEKNSRGGVEGLKRSKQIRDYVIGNLKDLAEGSVSLFDTAGALVAESTTHGDRVLCDTDDYHSTFDEDDPLNWTADPDKLSAIESGRD